MRVEWRTWCKDMPTAVAIACGVFAILVGVSALLGWALDLPILTDWMNQGISMFPNTALCAVAAGAALVLLVTKRSERQSRFVLGLGGFVLAIAGLTLFEHLTGINLGLDTLLAKRAWGQAASAAPMRMGPPASVSFLMLGFALLLAQTGSAGRTAATWLAIGTAAIAGLSLTGYLLGANQLFGLARFTGIALNTSIVVTVLSVGILAAISERGLAAALRRDDAGGSVHRRLIVPIIVLPLALGWIRLAGERAGYYDTAFGTALRSFVEILLFFGVLWWTARNISWHAAQAAKAQAWVTAIVHDSEDAIISKSLRGIIESWNAGAERTFGYTAAEAIGRHISLIIPADRIEEETEILARLNRGERVAHYETVRVRKDGVRISVSLTVSPIRDAEGQVIGASKIARDVTRRRLVEERLRAVVEATPECVKIVRADGALEYMNHAGLCMVEADSEQAVLGSCMYGLIAAPDRDAWIENHRRVIAGEKLNWEFEIVSLKGTSRRMETNAVPLLLPDGQTAQLAVTREVTARRQLERERESLLESERAARGEAERANHLKDEFLATLSHELRTPLNAILGWAQLLNVGSSQADLSQGLEAIERNARSQAKLIEDLLDMSRIMSGKVRLDVQPTDLANVIESAVDSIGPAAEAKGIRLRKVLDPHAGNIAADPTRMQQIIWNLLTNAVKFTPKGGKVDVVLERVNSHLEVTIHDNGIGIPAEQLPIVFERFRQVDSSVARSYGGLGLGLSIVKHLVELHGGTVAARSAGPGQGTTFVLTFPISPVRSHEQRVHPATRSSTFKGAAIDLAGVKVLVVDDEADARALIERVLTHCGAEVCAAGSAHEALMQLSVFQPHVLVSDVGMPGTDGYQFMRTVRSLKGDEGGSTPAIALTAFARTEDRMQALLAGYQVHVAKPIEPQELVVTVHTLSGRMGMASEPVETPG